MGKGGAGADAADRVNVPHRAIRDVVCLALAEDAPWGDITTEALVDPHQESAAVIVSKEDGVLAGLDCVSATFAALGDRVRVTRRIEDGQPFARGTVLADLVGSTVDILTGERVGLNLLQRLSGIATIAGRYVAATHGTAAVIVDTRKTTPGLRALEKYAIRTGGGSNHRMSLSDGVLIKDNHLAALRAAGAGIGEAVARARRAAPHTIRVEVEVTDLDQVAQAADAGADIILLDNMSDEQMAEAVRIVGGRALTEASGGIRLERIARIAAAGVNLISVGALTHSAPTLDLSLEILSVPRAEDAALVIVDLQRDFCPGGALEVPQGDAVVPRLGELVREFAIAGRPIVATRDWHPADSGHFTDRGGLWPRHCVKETDGARFHPALGLPAGAIVVSKGMSADADGYSGFEGTDETGAPLEAILREQRVAHLVVGGLATDYCVRATVLDALTRGYSVDVVRGALRGVDLVPGDSDRALDEMVAAGARVIP